jgi:ferredoxin
MSSSHDSLRTLDYSFVQQCMHCGFCLPTCPTYDATHLERNSPRGRIALMRAIADQRMDVTRNFAEEMYFCLGCLACMTACPAGVEYSQLFETSRAMAEQSRVLANPGRDRLRGLLLKGLFMRPALIRFVGRVFYVFSAQACRSSFVKWASQGYYHQSSQLGAANPDHPKTFFSPPHTFDRTPCRWPGPVPRRYADRMRPGSGIFPYQSRYHRCPCCKWMRGSCSRAPILLWIASRAQWRTRIIPGSRTTEYRQFRRVETGCHYYQCSRLRLASENIRAFAGER